MKQPYPSREDKFWMRPGTDLCCVIGPYRLLAVKSYGASKREATYQCICLRCGSLHELKRIDLQAMARAQKKRKLPFFKLHGCCPNCDESEPPRVTLREYALHNFAANGVQVIHVVRHGLDSSVARIRICSLDGSPATGEIIKPNGETVRIELQLDRSGQARWLVDPNAMLDLLLDEMEKAKITSFYYNEDGWRECLRLRP
jgi:hypothetical protein